MSIVKKDTNNPLFRAIHRDEFLTPFDQIFDEFFKANVPNFSQDFGVDFFGKSENVFIIPALGSFFLIFNFLLAVIFSGNKNFNFIANINFTFFQKIYTIIISIRITVIYATNARTMNEFSTVNAGGMSNKNIGTITTVTALRQFCNSICFGSNYQSI